MEFTGKVFGSALMFVGTAKLVGCSPPRNEPMAHASRARAFFDSRRGRHDQSAAKARSGTRCACQFVALFMLLASLRSCCCAFVRTVTRERVDLGSVAARPGSEHANVLSGVVS